jgi:hypothetical protein
MNLGNPVRATLLTLASAGFLLALPGARASTKTGKVEKPPAGATVLFDAKDLRSGGSRTATWRSARATS